MAPSSLMSPATASQMPSGGSKRQIVLVHGAWHGAWAWAKVTPVLSDMGYHVTAFDLSGLGADSQRQSIDVGLHIHGQDLLNHLYFNDITDAAVVAHSYGGAVLSQALAHDSDGRITHGIYFDAFRLGEGECVAEFQGTGAVPRMTAALTEGAMVPPRPPNTLKEVWGLSGPPFEFVTPRLRPMSPACFLEPVTGDPFAERRKLTYMRATQNPYPPFIQYHAESEADPRFRTVEVNCHHSVMVMDPPMLANAIASVV